jgi:hypothetical protein
MCKRTARPIGLASLAAIAAFHFGCGRVSRSPAEMRFPGVAAVKVSAASGGRWLVLFEELRPELLVTTPIRSAALVAGPGIVRTFSAPEGWVLVDAAAHPSGDVSLFSLRVDSAEAYPMRAMVSRIGSDGVVVERELNRLPPPGGTEPPPRFITSLDRARLVARGEDLFGVVRWANGSVQAYRLGVDGGTLEQRWVTWIEPPAPIFSVGIIGGGFDNFHQEDSSAFVHADVDGEENLYVAVESTADVLPSHDAFFGESLMAQADPESFDFGTAIVTRVDGRGARSPAALLGSPGRARRLLQMRVASGSVLLIGRIRTGHEPGSWDGWLLSSPSSGEPGYERVVDVDGGDMFWDAVALSGGRILVVGSTSYTQNPAGLSVSDARDALGLVLDASGRVERRLSLPAGPPGRGNEATSVSVGERGEIAICGVENAPGTHAPVFSDAFLLVQKVDSALSDEAPGILSRAARAGR